MPSSVIPGAKQSEHAAAQRARYESCNEMRIKYGGLKDDGLDSIEYAINTMEKYQIRLISLQLC
jgi:hypothetical protein